MGIAGNKFVTGSLTGIEQLVNLEELYISATKLDGSLPEEMGQLTKLKYIESSETVFTGIIPTSFGNLVNLKELDFSLNQLSGRLPEEFGQLTKLENIALYGNGEITFSWELIYSFLNNANQNGTSTLETGLSGTIPDTIGNWANIQYVDMSENSFTGDFGLPTTIGQWESVVEIKFHNSNIGGIIPTELGAITSLKLLDLSLSGIGGSIPSEIGSLKSLQILALYENALTGELP